MKKIRKGDIVARNSYGKDILFKVKRIIKKGKHIEVILTGLTERIEADSPVEDLEIVEKDIIKKHIDLMDTRLNNRVRKIDNDLLKEKYRIKQKFLSGTILHLDGDKRYASKSYAYYQKLGLNAVVKNIAEYKQPKSVYNLLKTYNPDILVITGHDGMIKKGQSYNDICNYRNSRYFINAVKEARRYDIENNKKLVIFAGACQSYFEALIAAGANFASSPARILIDFLDPLIVAEKIAVTEEFKYVTIGDLEKELKDGRKGVGGIGANGKMVFLA